MQIPISIEPDLLKDSIVEIRFNSEIDFSLIPGLLYTKLGERGFKFTGGFQPLKGVPQQLIVEPPPLPSFSNEVITCRLMGNSIIFNIKAKYIGWASYFSEIKSVMIAIDNLKIIQSYSRVGLRYINVLRDTNVYEKVVEDLRINLKSFKNVATNIKTDIVDESFRVKLNLGNDFRIQENNELVSVIDIDVIREERMLNLNSLFDIINKAHSKESEVFFSILRPEFLKTLNPKYGS